MAAALGVFLATIGLDAQDGTQRMTFGIVDLYDGISMNAMAIGLFAFSSVISQLFDHWQDLDIKDSRLKAILIKPCKRTALP